IDFDKENSLTHFIGQGILKISNTAKALIIYNNKEYDAASFKQQFGNTKFGDVFIYENEGAFNKFGEKGKHGVIMINDRSSASVITSPVISVNKKDTVPSTVELHKDDASIKLSKDNKQIIFDVKKNMDSVLFIVDDKEVDSLYMSKLNPIDIESITVLKNSSAITQYGEKGRNGVIIITTKKELEKNKPAINKKNPDVSFVSNDKSVYENKINILRLLEEYMNDPKFEHKFIDYHLGIDNPVLTKLIEDYDDLQTNIEDQLSTTNKNDTSIKEIEDQLRKIRREITHKARDIRNEYTQKLITKS
ncbi:MAG TPA: hypothetical protein VHZ50_13730, partial [Puia sp.]|nr:hypothetical protein [Puia sp.]